MGEPFRHPHRNHGSGRATPGDARGGDSFDVGPVHFISLESVTESTGEPAAVMTWLE